METIAAGAVLASLILALLAVRGEQGTLLGRLAKALALWAFAVLVCALIIVMWMLVLGPPA